MLPLPISSLKSGFPVLGNPANRNRAVPLTYEQFRLTIDNGWRKVAETALDFVRRFTRGR